MEVRFTDGKTWAEVDVERRLRTCGNWQNKFICLPLFSGNLTILLQKMLKN